MRVYIAAPYPVREDAQRLMSYLEHHGIEVTSGWLREEDSISHEHAARDLADIDDADALVVLNPEAFHNAGTGGRHVELGYAIAKGKRIILLGERTNMFHALDSIQQVKRFRDVIEVLGVLDAA
jgi:nucleoside 2-deoxyribosyltransferase